MSRVAVCLFFIAIVHTGIITPSQANETSTEGELKKDEGTTTPTNLTEAEPVKESKVTSKVEAENKSVVSSKTEPTLEEASNVTEKKNDQTTEGKEAKANQSKKDDVIQKITAGDNRKLLPDVLKGTPVEQTNVLFEFPKTILGPVNDVGTKIGEAVSKGIDTAKDFAGGTFNFLRTSAKNLFD